MISVDNCVARLFACQSNISLFQLMVFFADFYASNAASVECLWIMLTLQYHNVSLAFIRHANSGPASGPHTEYSIGGLAGLL